MGLSFIIPAFNEEAMINRCLDSVEKALAGKALDAEIIVVNNASTDRTRERALVHRGVRVVDEMRKGLGWARHAGFEAATKDLLANIDADTVLTPGWIDTVLLEFQKDSSLIALSGPCIYEDIPRYLQTNVRLFYRIGMLVSFCNRMIVGRGSIIQGGNFIVKKSALVQIGGFNTGIAFYGEDTDIAQRLEKAGRVKFTFALPVITSSRRLTGEGMTRMGLKYAANYFSVTYFQKPLTTGDTKHFRTSSSKTD